MRTVPHLLLAGLLSSTLAMAAPPEPPLYERFRPVTSLPWREPGATMESVLHRILHEPDVMPRKVLLEGYLATLSPESFSRALERCLDLEEDEAPDELLTIFMREWARADPSGAWDNCVTWIPKVFELNAMDVDEWAESVYAVDLAAVRKAQYCPTYPPIPAFLEGLETSCAAPEVKARLKDAAEKRLQDYKNASALAQGEEPSLPGRNLVSTLTQTPEQVLEEQIWGANEEMAEILASANEELLRRVLHASPAEMLEILRFVRFQIDEVVLARAMIKWMDGHPARGPEIVDEFLRLPNPYLNPPMPAPGEEGGFVTASSLPLWFLCEWAMLERSGYENWLFPEYHGRPEIVWPPAAYGVGMTMNSSIRLEMVITQEYDAMEKNPAHAAWAALDPWAALPWIWSRGGLNNYSVIAWEQGIKSGSNRPNIFRYLMRGLARMDLPIMEDPYYWHLSEICMMDNVWTAKLGVDWLFRTHYVHPDAVLACYNGRRNPMDGAVEDRTYGALRIWAVKDPEGMRAWVESTDLDDSWKEALRWLAIHAVGGFDLREGEWAADTRPVFRRFQAVGGLPWRETPNTMEVIEKIFQDPDATIRYWLLEDYLCTRSAHAFPRIFEACLEAETDESPDELLTVLIRAWAEADPEAAWEKTRALNRTVIEQHPLSVDSWGTGLIVLDPEAVRVARYWPGIPLFAPFRKGLEASVAPTELKDRLRMELDHAQAEYLQAFEAAGKRALWRGEPLEEKSRLADDEPWSVVSDRSWAEKVMAEASQQLLFQVLEAEHYRVAEILRQLRFRPNDAVLARALIRMSDWRAKLKSPEVARIFTEIFHVSAGELPLDFLAHWIATDSAGYLQWFDALPGPEKSPRLWGTAAAVRALPDLAELQKAPDEKHKLDEALETWAMLDPERALSWTAEHEPILFNSVVYGASYRRESLTPNVFRTISDSDIIRQHPEHLDYHLTGLMEAWVSQDAPEAAKYGRQWLLEVGGLSKEQLTRYWSAQEDPPEGGILDRTFGALRLWAARNPEEMGNWIAGLTNEEERVALDWLVTHTTQGYPLEKRGDGDDTTYHPKLPPEP